MGSPRYGYNMAPTETLVRHGDPRIDADYKSLKVIVPESTIEQRNGACTNIDPVVVAPTHPMYMNGRGSDISDSVKYYVLEDGTTIA